MQKILTAVDVYKWIVLIAILILGTSIGYVFVGPFLTSGVLEWAEKQVPIVKELISVESMIIDSLISSCVPMFLLWSISFYLYSNFKNHLENLNKALPFFWLFAQSPATLILFLSSLLVGICIYGWVGHEHSASLKALSVLSIFFLLIGFVVRASCTPELKENKFLDKYSKISGHICVFLTLSAYLWGVLSDPISLFMIINESMANG